MALLSLGGCGGDKVALPPGATSTTRATSLGEPAPEPGSPRDAVQLLLWSVNHLDAARYTDLLTDDYRFVLAAADSAGNLYRAAGFTREDEALVARHMFETGAAELGPLTRADLTFDPLLVPVPDPRPGKTFPWHQEIRTRFELSAENSSARYYMGGAVRFFLVRGDSAQIPPDLVARGVVPDSTRWWIERWEEEAAAYDSDPAVAAGPRRTPTWGYLKLLYIRPGP